MHPVDENVAAAYLFRKNQLGTVVEELYKRPPFPVAFGRHQNPTLF
jgi:hypothetical protein